jgi:hypothetical protein
MIFDHKSNQVYYFLAKYYKLLGFNFSCWLSDVFYVEYILRIVLLMFYMKDSNLDIFERTATPNYYVNLNFYSLVLQNIILNKRVDLVISIISVAFYKLIVILDFKNGFKKIKNYILFVKKLILNYLMKSFFINSFKKKKVMCVYLRRVTLKKNLNSFIVTSF